ncbi:MAG: hypothetical protein GXY58_19400 [Planctomycetaceae bacterium]|nr:hypothetical protein [Planctomycetaceae bacterium]
MAKKRAVGRGAKVSVDPAGGTAWQDVGATVQITPPPQERSSIDVTAMEDNSAQAVPGIEQISEFVFEGFHDPDDAVDDAIDALYSSGNEANWKITLRYSATSTWTKVFKGRVLAIVPTGFDANGRVTRQVRVVRTGDIEDTVA